MMTPEENEKRLAAQLDRELWHAIAVLGFKWLVGLTLVGYLIWLGVK